MTKDGIGIIFWFEADYCFTIMSYDDLVYYLRTVWRCQRGNQNSYIEEKQTTQWQKEKSTKGQTTIYKAYT
jgi:hypothetical protein